MTGRREFVTATASAMVWAALLPATDGSRALRIEGKTFRGHDSRVFDAVTGEDISSIVPIEAAGRLFRSWKERKPKRIWLYSLNDEGQKFVQGNSVAKELALVRVIDWRITA